MKITRIIKRYIPVVFSIFVLGFAVFAWQVYFPKQLYTAQSLQFLVEKGQGDEEIAKELEKQGIIKNNYFFRLYVFVFGKDSKLQAGIYSLSPNMTIPEIVDKMVSGDVVKEVITIIEGWNTKNIANYFSSKELYKEEEFLKAVRKDYSSEFDFLKDKPRGLDLLGYLFPDTYYVSTGQTAEETVKNMLSNFGKKLNKGFVEEIYSQKKTVFEVITMASIIEKEVSTVEDKKIVAGILWKRLEARMPLQVDATVNFITGKNDSRAKTSDVLIDSPYNTYKYKGLPKGPISNPGMDSILAAIYPEKTSYWYYLSGVDGRTIFSRTFKEHNEAKSKYLNIGG